MNISILTGTFFPNIHPRAFRAKELAEEFERQGHHVTVINLRTVDGFNYDEYAKKHNLKIINLGIFNENRLEQKAARKKSNSWWERKKRFLIEYLFNGYLFSYGPRIAKKLNCLKSSDMVIALSTPFPCHYGFYKYVKKNGRDFVAILDSGDPFYNSHQTPRAFWFKYLAKEVYRNCDFLTIPTENAISLYTPLISKEKIKVIPQGFNMRNLKVYSGNRTAPVKFAYAGVFYWDIRNPEFIFKVLENIQVDYEFYIFMRYKDARLDDVLEKYPNVRRHIKMQFRVPHDELIYELSKMHFLLNIENLSNTQMPSKLIDYGIVKRPILSCNENNFEESKLLRFLNGDYRGSYEVNVDEYNIEVIASKFLDLYRYKRQTVCERS